MTDDAMNAPRWRNIRAVATLASQIGCNVIAEKRQYLANCLLR